MKKILLSILCLIIVLAGGGCTAKSIPPVSSAEVLNSSNLSEDKYTFTDYLGNEVSVSYRPKNVAVLFASYLDIWQLAGGESNITVEESILRGFITKDKAQIVGKSGGKEINSELLLASKPDFVIMTSDYQGQLDMYGLLKENNIPAAVFHVDSFGQYLDVLKIFTDICQTPEAYEEYGTKVTEQIELLKDKIPNDTEQKSVLLLRAFSTGVKAKGNDNFVGAMLEDMNTYNIAADAKVLLEEFSLEEIVKQNPDYIFVTTMGSSEEEAIGYLESLTNNNEAWSSLSAIKNGSYYVLPKELFHYKPNARWGESYEYIGKILYPDKF